MLPFLDIFGIKLPMYGLLMVTGATLAILFASLRGHKRGVDKLDVLLCSVFCFVSGLLGAKILFIITDIPNMIEYFSIHGFDFMVLLDRIKNAGIVFYGGLIGGFLGGYIYVRLFKLNFWQVADELIPWLPLAHGFGRIGCFCAGCCYGRAMDSPLSVVFPAAGGVPRLPVQLFEAGFDILILLPVLLLFSKKQRKPGQIVGLYLVMYGVFRFINEYLRADEIRGIFGGISTSQWISMALVPCGIILLTGVIGRFCKHRYVCETADGEIICDCDEAEDAAEEAQDEESGARAEEQPGASGEETAAEDEAKL